MKRVLVAVFGPVSTDSRVVRQIDALSESFELTVVGYGPFEDPRVTFHQIGDSRDRSPKWGIVRLRQLLEVGLCAARLYSLSYWLLNPAHRRFKRVVQNAVFDLILVNDPEGVAVATRFARANPVVVHDQHEYWPDLFINPLKRWAVTGYRRWYVEKYLAPLPHWITVADGIGKLYRDNFSMTRPVIITNAPGYVDLNPSRVTNNRIDLVFQGIWDPARGIEVMIQALSQLPHHFHLNLIIVGRGKKHLRSIAVQHEVNERVHFHPAVLPSEVANYINVFDVALILNMPVNDGFKFSLPNKLFEAIQARLAIITGPSPEIGKVVTAGQCGLVLDDFSAKSLAENLKKLTATDIEKFKEHSAELAQNLSAEKNAAKMRKMLHEIGSYAGLGETST